MLPYLPIEYLNAALGDAVDFEKKEVVEVILTSPGVSVDAIYLQLLRWSIAQS
jgi:hypothetical protein